MNALTKLIKLAAGEEMPDPGLQAMADAADIAKGPAGMPGIKIHPDKADGKDESKEVMRVAHELDAKTKEIAGLRQQLQEAKMDAQRVQVKAEITNEQTKMREGLRQEQQRMLEGLRREQERMYAQIRQEQKELDKKQSELQIAEARQKGELTAAKAEYEAGHTAAQAQYEAQFTAAEAQNRANMAIEQAQHQAQLDKDVSAHDAQIAQSKADSLMDIAQQTTDMYIKQTEKARADADKYFTTQQQQYSASHPVISPALQSRLDGAMQSVGRVGKNLKDMTSMSKLGRAMRDFEKVADAFTFDPSWVDAVTAKKTQDEEPTRPRQVYTPHPLYDPRKVSVPQIRKSYISWIADRDRKGIEERNARLAREGGRAYSDLRTIMGDYSDKKLEALKTSGNADALKRALYLRLVQNDVKPYLNVGGFNPYSNYPFAGGQDLATRATATALLINLRAGYAKRAKKMPLEGQADPKVQLQILDDVIEDYRRANSNYYRFVAEMMGDPNLPIAVRNKYKRQMDAYIDATRGVNTGGRFYDDDIFTQGKFDYAHNEDVTGKYDPNEVARPIFASETRRGRLSPVAIIANSFNTYNHDKTKSRWENLKEYFDEYAEGLADRSAANALLDDYYRRHSQGVEGSAGETTIKSPGDVRTFDPRYMWNGKFPDYGDTPEEIEANRKAMERANDLFDTFTGAGKYLGNAGGTIDEFMRPFYLTYGLNGNAALLKGILQRPSQIAKGALNIVKHPVSSLFELGNILEPYHVYERMKFNPRNSDENGNLLEMNEEGKLEAKAPTAARTIPFSYLNREGQLVTP